MQVGRQADWLSHKEFSKLSYIIIIIIIIIIVVLFVK